jgi:hypothetical protein
VPGVLTPLQSYPELRVVAPAVVKGLYRARHERASVVVTVMFEAVGEKRLAVDFVLTHRLLKALEP